MVEEARGAGTSMLYGVTALGEVDQQRYPANSSSKALASCKSAVSKPSVNQ
jgi:hypothetical protein